MGDSWTFSPLAILGIFCSLNLLNFMERGVIASNGVNGAPPGPPACEGCASDPGSGIQAEFGLSNYADGLLASSFLIGLLVASPLFAHASKTHSPLKLIVIGLSTWTVAVAGGALAPNFAVLLLSRMLVGVGEACFVNLAIPVIDDVAPAQKRASWISTFYLCIPCGFALGYVMGGYFGPLVGWRATFLLEASMMVPFVVLFGCAPPAWFRLPCLVLPAVERERLEQGREVAEGAVAIEREGSGGGRGDGGGSSSSLPSAPAGGRGVAVDMLPSHKQEMEPDALRRLHGSPARGLGIQSSAKDDWPVGVETEELLGTTTPTAPLNNVQSPSAVEEAHSLGAHQSHSSHTSPSAPLLLNSHSSLLSDVSLLFQNPTYRSNALASSAFTFVLGSYAYWGPKAGAALFNLPLSSADSVFGAVTLFTGVVGTLAGGLALDRLGSSTLNALRLQAAVTAAACALCVASFLSPSMPGFFALLTLGQLCLFSAGGPMNLVCMQAAPHHLRSLAIATGTVLLHLLGDVPSPPLLGALQDAVGNWRVSMSVLTTVLLVAAGIWADAARRIHAVQQQPECEAMMGADRGMHVGA